MKAKQILVILIAVLFSPVLRAQQVTGCPSDGLNDSLILHNPQISRSFMYLEQRIAQQQAIDPSLRDETVYTIPIVVHVIHEGEAVGTGSNISDEQISSAITALNEDYRKLAGTNGYGDGVDVGIDFCLAARDPNGNATTGIVRVNGSSVPNYADMGIEATTGTGADEAAVKALSTWPREDYVNIWIVNEIENNDAGSGIQGYAYFPFDSPLDGIVILYNAFGTVGNLKSYTDMNRTVSHEMGHYFGLYHTFHATTTCNAEGDCTIEGDHCCDTPITPLNTNCSVPECSGTQQVENYMDYTPETCKNMFTEGQKVRMRATLLEDRATLLASLGCMPVSNLDAGITAIAKPSVMLCEMTFSPEVQLTNFGSQSLSTTTIHYNIDGVGNNVYVWNGTLATSQSILLELPAISTSSGSHTFYCWTSDPNNAADQNSSNDQRISTYVVAPGLAATLDIELDYFGGETTWQIADSADNIVSSGGPYVNNQQGLIMEENLCLNAGCYVFTIFDAYGDGLGWLYGDYTLSDAAGTTLAFGSGDFGDEAVHNVCIVEVPIEGFPPIASFTTSDATPCTNQLLDFTNTSTESPVIYSWQFEGGSPSTSSAMNPQDVTWSAAGSYDVTLTVTNDYGTDSYVCANCIVVAAGPTLATTATNLTCYNNTSGSINLTPTGNSPFSYLWNTGATTQDVSSLSAGAYSVTVTDVNGCSKVKNQSVSQPSDITITATTTPVSCFGDANGSITAQATGGTGSISWTWNTGASGATLNNVAAGSYTTTATDANACQKQQVLTLSQPTSLQTNLTAFNISCNDLTGSAVAAPSGGTSPYSVSWSNGVSANQSGNLNAGNYSVTVTDAHSCQVITPFAITESDGLSMNGVVEGVTCNGDGDGAITIQVAGGAGPYTYLWNDGNTSYARISLQPGTYSVVVTDSEGCSGSGSYDIDEPLPLTLAVFKTDISCHGLNDGSATATANGGSGNHNYTWDNGMLGNSVSGLEQGLYNVTVMDANGCVVSELISIVEPSLLVASGTATQSETCVGSNGAAVVNAMGGTPGYSYLWSNGVAGQSISDLSSGNYIATVQDGNECVSAVSVNVPYDCSVNLPVTELVSGDCGTVGFALNGVISCNAVSDVEMYQWRFTNLAGNLLTEAYSIDPSYMLSQVSGLTWGMTVNVNVRVLFQDMWGPYGNTCQITIVDPPTTAEIDPASCGVTGLHIGDAILATEILQATVYEWHIQGLDYDLLTYTDQPTLILTSAMQLYEFTAYSVTVRVLASGIWTDESEQCSFEMGTLTGVEETTNGNDLVQVYPNPGAGDKIIIDFGNPAVRDRVQDLVIYGPTGNLIENIQLSPERGMKYEYKFSHPLSSGVYILRYTIDDTTNEKRIIVR